MSTSTAPTPATSLPGFRRICRQLASAVLGCAAALTLAGTASAANLLRIESGRANVATFLLQGPILGGELKLVQTAVAKLPAGTSIAMILDSTGGDLHEGLSLGAFFYDTKIATIVKGDGGVCLSACAMAFLGGRDSRTGERMRIKMSGGKLGFHQFRKAAFDPLKIYTLADHDEQVAETQRVTNHVVLYLQYIREDLTKLQLMLRAPADGMNFISNEDCPAQGFSVLDQATGRTIDAPAGRQRVSSLN